MPTYDQRPFKPGDPLLAARLNAIEDELRRLGSIRGGEGVDVRHGRQGVQITAGSPAVRHHGAAVGTITGRADDDTSGAGDFDVHWIDPTGGKLADSGQTLYDVKNNGPEVPDGLECDVVRDGFGPWTVVHPAAVGAVVTTAIPTGTATAPSTTGAAQVYRWNASTSAWVAAGSPVVVYNRHTLSASIATGKAVTLAPVGNHWHLIAADC